jgi:3',5'-cyclic AMP phosphodiesterase CpdA
MIAKFIADPTAVARARWVELAHKRAKQTGAHPDFIISRSPSDTISVLLLADTGEGDNSQYAVTSPLLAMSKDVDFAVICSDVVYPTGDFSDYDRKFNHPYRNLRPPIYAVPGNHDWYDGLHGFMHYFCGLDDEKYLPKFGCGPAAFLAGLLWRKAPAINAGAAMQRRPPDPIQPAPYFALDAGPIRFIGIDTGITGEIDEDQYHWLQRVSLNAPQRPKILLTGKPIYVDGKYHPGRVTGTTKTVDDLIVDPRANYVMTIGGDIHNYQRYPVPVAGERTIQYVVSGGGGAYMHGTHRIPLVNINGVEESTFKCYPLRRDSLARFAQVVDKTLFGGTRMVTIDATAAARYYQRRGIITSLSDRPVVARLSWNELIRAAIVHRIPSGRFFQRVGSEVFDFDDPPFFKQFLRIDVNGRRMTMTCFGVIGCANTEHTPSVEDQCTIDF